MISTRQVKDANTTVQAGLCFLQSFMGNYHPRDFAVHLWDGTLWPAEPGQPTRFTLALKHAAALRKMFWPANERSLGEAYIYDDFDIEGDIESVFSLGSYLEELSRSKTELLQCARHLLKLPSAHHSHNGRQAASLSGKRHSVKRDQSAVTYHYDVSNDFYGLWLDKQMIYSCAYFASPTDTLDAAQERKLDYICRKLRLRPGERLLDVGCGWGGLVMHAAKNYGVRAAGITLSRPQADLANQRIHRAGLSSQCRVEVRDYRKIDQSEEYDKLVSVGMFEHVGAALLPEYFQRAWHLLRPGGVFLNHGIACRAGKPMRRREPSFVQSYVFPDGELVPISTALDVAEMSGFEVRDVESLREHYALTLRHWVGRLESNHEKACQAADEVTYRIWRLFMAGSAYGFKAGRLNVYQTLLAKPTKAGNSKLPLTRTDWYTQGPVNWHSA